MNSEQIASELIKEYDLDKEHAESRLEERKQEVYSAVPRIREIENELGRLGIKLVKAYMQSADKQKTIEEIKAETERLKVEKEELLIEKGYGKDYLKISFRCPLCEDTGFVDGNACACYKQRLIEKKYNMSNVSNSIVKENFSTFSYDYYSKEIDRKHGVSPYDNICRIMRFCESFIENFDKGGENLFFYGGSGLGKTFLCNCIAKELLDKGKTVVYMTSYQLFEILIKNRFDSDNNNDDLESLINEVELLIIDDLGTENSNSITVNALFNCINQRMLDKKPTIISSNISPTDMLEVYSRRIVSRILGEYKVLQFIGEDIRIQKIF